MNGLMRLNQYLPHAVKTYTPELWFPSAIVLLKSIIHILNTQYIYAQLELSEIPRNIQIAISVLGGFSVIVGAFISWLLISVVVFFWCELFYDVEGTFRVFFELVGICHLALLVGTLFCSFFILFGLPGDLTMLETKAADSQALLEAITGTLLPLKFIGVVGDICFALVLVLVIQAFFQIKWIKAFCSVSIPYAIYWTLSKVLQSVFQFN